MVSLDIIGPYTYSRINSELLRTNSMIWIVATLTLLFSIAYAIYRTARTEATGNPALDRLLRQARQRAARHDTS